VFTNGPPRNHLDEELMTFDDSDDVINLNDDDQNTAEQVSPVESANPLSTFDDAAPNEEEQDQLSPNTSNESADEEVKSVLGHVQEETEDASSAITVPPNGLPKGYTQAQLDEVRAFNAGLTKGRSFIW